MTLARITGERVAMSALRAGATPGAILGGVAGASALGGSAGGVAGAEGFECQTLPSAVYAARTTSSGSGPLHVTGAAGWLPTSLPSAYTSQRRTSEDERFVNSGRAVCDPFSFAETSASTLTSESSAPVVCLRARYVSEGSNFLPMVVQSISLVLQPTFW